MGFVFLFRSLSVVTQSRKELARLVLSGASLPLNQSGHFSTGKESLWVLGNSECDPRMSTHSRGPQIRETLCPEFAKRFPPRCFVELELESLPALLVSNFAAFLE